MRRIAPARSHARKTSRRRIAAVLVAAFTGALATAASAGPTPERAAACVAALKVRAEMLARQLQSGDTQVQNELTTLTEHGFAFIGDAYLNGHRNEQEAKAKLKAAEEAQSRLSEAQLAQRQASCQAEATKLLADAGFFNRKFVAFAARARVSKLKSVPAARPSKP